ncbi:MAG: hypothetical protein ACREQR_01765 [Candidatus Binataceae bacterium]
MAVWWKKVWNARAGGIAAFLLYLALSLLFFGRGLFGAFTSRYIGHGTTDCSVSMWFIRWWPYAIAHHLNPLFSKLIWAPAGATLAWTTTIPLPALAAFPVYHFLGAPAAYNTLCIVAPVLAAFAAYLLCRWVVGDFWPSVLGGFVFGFSAYMLNQMLAHVCLVMVWPIPLALLAGLKRYAGENSSSAYAVSIALLLAAQFLIFPELLASMTVFAMLAFALALAILPDRARLLRTIVPTALGYVLATLILSPYLYEMLVTRSPSRPIYPLDIHSADLLNFIVPTAANLLGTISPLMKLSDRFSANIAEQGVCLTLPLIVIAELWRRARWRTPEGKLGTLMLLAAIVASMGTVLKVLGKRTVPMPWALAAHLPFIAPALPIRFTLYAFLMLAIIAASWFASTKAGRGTKLVAAAAVIVFMLPNPSAAFWTSPINTPAFFRDGTWQSYLRQDDIVLALPFERDGNSMLWQATANMGFRMAGGYTSIIPFEFDRLPIIGFFAGARDLPEAAEQLKAFIASHQIAAIVEDLTDPNFTTWSPVLDQLGLSPVRAGGVLVYRFASGSFATYGQVSSEQLETRAIALRFDLLLEAVASYVSKGRPIRELSGPALYNDGLLPADWKLSSKRYARTDYQVFADGDHVAIAMGGSYPALRPLAERCAESGAEVYYPYPERWSSAREYPTHSLAPPLVLVFDRVRLAAAAAQLRNSPPVERTRSLLPRAALALATPPSTMSR